MTKPCGQMVLKGGAMASDALDFHRYCTYPRMKGKRQCEWHYLLKQPAQTQKAHAGIRYADAIVAGGGPDQFWRRDRVPKTEWPEGERWCAGCQSFVPLFYTSGSRCKSCASTAAHEAMVMKTYGLEPGEYDALFKMQGGRCFICQRKSPSRRLAVDHDHVTGAVRGLLCPDPDRGCNHAILGPLEASPGGALAAAKRMVLYLERTPYERLKGAGPLSWEEYLRADLERIARERTLPPRAAEKASAGTLSQEPPF
jgi:hypothetical protein